MESVKLYVGTYKKYTEGSIEGAWLDLEDYDTYEEFIEACLELHKDEKEPELMFQDCDNLPYSLYCECDSSNAFNYQKAMEEVERDGYSAEAFEAYIELFIIRSIDDVDGIVRAFEDSYITELESDSASEIGHYAVEELEFLGEIPDRLSCYLDYEKIGHDLLITDWVTSNGYLFSRAY